MTGLASRLLVCILLLVFSPVATQAATKKVAMVVGNGAYQSLGALPNTLNDATAIAASLERIGFTVFPAYDLTQAALLDEFAKFSRALEGADSAVFYYAGHGIQIDAENYILPVDLKLENEMSVRYGALSLTDVLRDIESRSRVSIVILDACRDNPLADILAAEDPSRSTSAARGLAPMKPSGNGTIIAYAAAPGQVASDGDDGHSPYTGALLSELERPGVEVGLLFRRVAGHVIDETGGIQRPEILVRLASEYYLSDLPPVPAVQPPPLPVAAVATPEPAPVDVAQVMPVAATTAEDRQVADAAGTRAALWDYASTLVVSPIDPPNVAWPAPDSEEAGETDGNTTFGTAQVVGPNDKVRIAIAPVGDREFLRFNVQQNGRLVVQAPEVPADIDLALRLLNANGDEVYYWVVAPRPGGEFYAEFDIGRPGAYWLEIGDGNGDAASTDRFNLSLQYLVDADLYEPNNRPDTAKHIALDSVFPISVFPKRDRDFFKFSALSAGSLIVGLTKAPEGITTSLHLLDANGAELVYWVPAPRPGGDNLTVFDLPRPGVYYLEIADSGDAAADVAPVQFSTRFAPSPDLFEPNDVMAAAYPVAPTSKSTMAIFPARDSDWIELDIDQPGELLLDIASPPANLQLTWRVLDGNGTEQQYWSPAARPGGDLSGSFDFPLPGRYYIQIADNDGAASSLEPFDVELNYTASLDAYEPNNTLGAAKPLTPGGEVQFTMLPLRDADWFRVSVDQPGELAVSIDEGPENLDLTYRVVNSDWTELAYWVAAYRKGGLTEGSVDLPRAGTYYLEVRDSGDDGRSIEPATLKTVFTPTANSNEPNNTYGEATPVDITGETVAQILPLADGDWQVFYAEAAGELDVEITGVPENLDISFRVLDAERAEIQYWINAPRPGGDTSGTVALPHAGWYWMEIRDGNNDARSPLPFTVKRTFRPVS
jgi:uncharacterized caspase-like protein